MSLSASSRRNLLSSSERHHSPVDFQNADLKLTFLIWSRDIKMQNILLTAKGVLKIGALKQFDHTETWALICKHKADFGMARAYSPRPLTPGVSGPFLASSSHVTTHLDW